MKRALGLLLLANIGVVLAEIILAPSNTVVIVGEEMEMTCLTNNNSRVRKWDIFTADRNATTIYSANKFHKLFNHFGVDVDDNGSGILYTNSTNLSDAGIYKCLSVIDGQDKEHSAQLTVLEAMPTCEENFPLNSSKSLLNGDYIWMQCNVSFRGYWTPTIEWIEYGDHLGPEERSVTEGVEVTRIPNTIVTSNLTIVVNSSRDGSRFACRIYFAKYDGTHNMTASNIPNFTYTWTSSVIVLSSFFSSEYVSTTLLDAVESSTVTPTTQEDLKTQSPTVTDWYIISLSLVVALSVFLIIIVVLVVAFCIRFKKKLSAKYASAAAVGKLEMPIRDGDYDILPYATSDNYDTIDDAVMDVILKVSFAPRQGPLPTPGYSGLTQMEPTAPGVYSRIDTYETPEDIAPESRDMKILATLETISEKQVDDSKEKKKREEIQASVQPYLELFDAANPATISEKHVHDSKKKVNGKGEMDSKLEEKQTPVHPYIELVDVVVADNSDECKRTSDCDIPSSYLTVNF